MTSPETESDPPVPWYRPVLRIIERFNTRDNIILGSGKLNQLQSGRSEEMKVDVPESGCYFPSLISCTAVH